ncbi:peptidoglycan recognition family protein [Streptomyces sp. SYP-A7185]|uniref:peptidoglycan recognition protein family protein n=1 Tax=Streptomyces sp. SYP-A7185 TaxID=3040076 RepID=UPI0038F644DB
MSTALARLSAASLGQLPARPPRLVVHIHQVLIQPLAPHPGDPPLREGLPCGDLPALLVEPLSADFTLVTIGRVTVDGRGTGAFRVAVDVDRGHLTGETSWVLPATAAGYFRQETRVHLRTDLPPPRHLDYRVLVGTPRRVVAEQRVRLETATLDAFLDLAEEGENQRPAGRTRLEYLTSVRKLRAEPGLVLYRQRMVNNRRNIPPFGWSASPPQAPRGPLAARLAALLRVQHGFEQLDLAQVLAGIDGADRQTPGPLFPDPRADLALTWSGDLGLALAAYVRARHAPGAPATDRDRPLDHWIARHASLPRLLGDIDGVNLGASYDPHVSLATQLRAYYGDAVTRRCTAFVAATKTRSGAPALPLAPGFGAPRFAPAAVDFVAGQIVAFAEDFLRFALGGAYERVRDRAGDVLAPNSPEVRQLAHHLMDFVQEGLAAELSPPADTSLVILRRDGTALPHVAVRLIHPSQGRHEGVPATSDLLGTVAVPDAGTRAWTVACADHELVPAADATTPLAVAELRPGRTPPDPGFHHRLPPGTTTELVAREVLVLVCPRCDAAIRVVEPPPLSLACPHDGYDLSDLRTTVLDDIGRFTAPVAGQRPERTPLDLRSCGTRPIQTAHGTVAACWDESRFLHPARGDYELWAATPRGPLSVSIVGRTTWGAAPLRIEPPLRAWEFHQAASGPSAPPPYRDAPVPLSENRPLASVYRWITVHHSADPMTFTPEGVREVQRDQIARSKSDIGYHYVIDGTGTIYEGRPLGIEGDHSELFNAANLGILLTGDFERRPENGWIRYDGAATPAQLQSLDDLVDVLAVRFGCRSVWSHQERKKQAGTVNRTECPGQFLRPHVDALRRRYPGTPF